MAIECSSKMSVQNRMKITSALDEVRKCVEKNESRLPIDLFDTLQNFFDNTKRPKIDVFVSQNTAGTWAESGGYSVWINPRCFEAREFKPGASRLAAELFHELVHLANGNELDCEFYENLIFSEEASPPTMDDWEKFKAVNFQGWWVHLDPPESKSASEPATVVDLWRQDPTKFLSDFRVHQRHGTSRTLDLGSDVHAEVASRSIQGAHPDEASHAAGQKQLIKKETTVSAYQEQLAQAKLEKLAATKDHLGVRITVEFTGHLHKDRIEVLLQKMKGVIVEDVDNGGGGQ